MAKKVEDLTGKVFGRLTVLHRADDWISPSSGMHRAAWWCRCSCGKELSIKHSQLMRGSTRSCGCLQKEELVLRNKKGKKSNIYDLTNEYGVCYTEKKDWFWYFDKEDYELIKPYYWHNVQGYAQSRDQISGRVLRMHRLVLGLGKCNAEDDVVDHINGLTYDNRKQNLRICSRSQNSFNQKISTKNTTGVIGVTYRKRNKKWDAAIGINNKSIYLGSFENFEDAVKARKEAEEKYFGEFSYDNSRGNKEEGS